MVIFTTDIKNEQNSEIPSNFYLSQNYPNPFNPSTTIKYSNPNPNCHAEFISASYNSEIPKQVRHDNVNVALKVYDILGREVVTLVNESQKPGNYEVKFNCHSGACRNLTSGVYFYQLTVGASTGSASNFVETKKMILLR